MIQLLRELDTSGRVLPHMEEWQGYVTELEEKKKDIPVKELTHLLEELGGDILSDKTGKPAVIKKLRELGAYKD